NAGSGKNVTPLPFPHETLEPPKHLPAGKGVLIFAGLLCSIARSIWARKVKSLLAMSPIFRQVSTVELKGLSTAAKGLPSGCAGITDAVDVSGPVSWLTGVLGRLISPTSEAK